MSSIHGNLQQIAFFVLFPIGALIAFARHHIGDGWLKYHIFVQLLATCIVFAAVAMQLLKRRTKTKDPIPPKLLWHITLGSIVTVLLVIQILWAFFGRRLVDWIIWYRIHIALATLILAGGITNILIGKSMH